MQVLLEGGPRYTRSASGVVVPKVIVIGARHKFPSSLLRSVSSEIGALPIERLDALEPFFSLSADERAGTLLLIIDEDIVFDLTQLDPEQRLGLRATSMALAYLDPRLPSEVLASRNLSPYIQSYLPMNVRFDVFVAIIRLLIDGGVYIPHEVRESQVETGIATPVGKSDLGVALSKSERLGALSTREMEVLELISKGKQNKSIAADLGLSEHTVKLHIHKIIYKLRVNNRTGAAALFLSGD